ncbi:MAG: hypothetical protein A3K45_09105 [Chloroflexi bacterium RIFOXYC12_FULL_59_14]|nr:MAG: hypothetical protein A3K45_09105 [Chloroflexi bacterium RIFOXYC12_FULL_59_14]OGO80114.1 MAG: hypothetical protein A3K41_08755 [Chloroflexi bacterium RIFOXYD12_FULL_57_15]OIN89577.1 MAG: hypothetical protein AUJ21_09495 [Anaerolineae bacterium CG1_02_58_13]
MISFLEMNERSFLFYTNSPICQGARTGKINAMTKSRRCWLVALGLILPCLLATQLQPVFLRALGAVDGTFGLRPVSHKCAGITLTGDAATRRFPSADWEGTFGLFRVRYFVPREAMDRDFCLGQDVWRCLAERVRL